MWKEESDVARVYRTMAAQKAEGDGLYQKFQSASRESVRLAAALRGFFSGLPLSEEASRDYAAYLKRRVRPAAIALIELDELDALQRLVELGWLDARLVDELLHTAIRERRSELAVYLLRLKDERYGYPDRDFTF